MLLCFCSSEKGPRISRNSSFKELELFDEISIRISYRPSLYYTGVVKLFIEACRFGTC